MGQSKLSSDQAGNLIFTNAIGQSTISNLAAKLATENFSVATDGTNIIYSYDGFTWISSIVPAGVYSGIAWNGSYWLAVDSNAGLIISSSDGINWQAQSSSLLSATAVCWNGSLWMVSGTGPHNISCVITSPDGITWSPTLDVDQAAAALVWNGLYWLNIGSGGLFSSYDDGMSWLTLPLPNTVKEWQATAAAWNGQWVVTGSSGKGSGNADDQIAFNEAMIAATNTTSIISAAIGLDTQLVELNISVTSTLATDARVAGGVNVNAANTAVTAALALGDPIVIYAAKVAVKKATSAQSIASGALSRDFTNFLNNSTAFTTITTQINDAITAFNLALTTGTTAGILQSVLNDLTSSISAFTSAATATAALGAKPSNTDIINWVNALDDAVTAAGTAATQATVDRLAVMTSSDGNYWTSRVTPLDGLNVSSVAWNGSFWLVVSSDTGTIISSNDGITWTAQATPLLKASSVSWNGSLWIVTGQYLYDNRYIITSPDGITWTPQATPLGKSQSYVVTSRRLLTSTPPINKQITEQFCVVAGQTGLVCSYDTVTWLPVAANNENLTYNTTAWNGVYWLAGSSCSNYSVISRSLDGITWTTVTSPMDGNGTGTCTVNAIAWNGSIWVAGGNGNSLSIMTSLDGINWIAQISPYDNVGTVNSIAWNGLLWVAGGKGPTAIATSRDGINWIGQFSRSFDPSPYLTYDPHWPSEVKTVAWNGTKWLAGGVSKGRAMATSTDGITWTKVRTPFDADITEATNTPTGAGVQSITWNGTYWIAVGTVTTLDKCVAISKNGLKWIVVPSPFDGQPLGDVPPVASGVAWNGNIWIVTGNSPTAFIATVNDLQSYLDETKATQPPPWSVLPNSTQGANAITIRQAPSNEIQTLAVNTINGSSYTPAGITESFTVAVGNGANGLSAITSYDGQIWYGNPKGNLPRGNYCTAIGWNGIYWAAIDNGSSVWTSSDGSTWFQQSAATLNAITIPYTPPQSCIFSKIQWNGTLWLATGNTIAYSPDAINWTEASWGSSNPFIYGYCTGAAWNGRYWVAVGFHNFRDLTSGIQTCTGIIVTSSDGCSWSSVTPPANFLTKAMGGQGKRHFKNKKTGAGKIARRYGKPRRRRGGFFDITWNGTIWAAVGYTKNNGTDIVTSTDGQVWTALGLSFDSRLLKGGLLNGIVWNGASWLVYGNTIGLVTFTNSGSQVPLNGGRASPFAAIVNDLSTVAFALSPKPLPYKFAIESVVWNGSKWIALYSDGSLVEVIIDKNAPLGVPLVSPLNKGDPGRTNKKIGSGYALATRTLPPVAPAPLPNRSTPPISKLIVTAAKSSTTLFSYSYDAINWLPAQWRQSPSAARITCITYGNSLWLAGDVNSQIYWSSDGINWNGPSTPLDPSSSAITNIAWNGTTWLTSCYTSLLYSNTDPTTQTWTQSIPLPAHIRAVVWGGLWIARGDSGLYVSYDGVMWTAANIPGILTQQGLLQVVWNGSLWLLITGNGIGYSYDGVVWNVVTLSATLFPNPGATITGLAWNGSIWAVTGNIATQTGTAGFVYYSYDGTTWYNTQNLSNFQTVDSITWNGVLWIASVSGSLYYSPDLINWYNSKIIGSAVATTYQLTPPPVPASVSPTLTENFCVAAAEGIVGYSYDGLNWLIGNNGSVTFTAIVWNGSYWLATDSSSTYISPDGINWTNNNTSTPFKTMAWNGSIWVGVGGYNGQGTIATSPDGINWSYQADPFTNNQAYGIAWNGAYWVVVGDNTGGSTIATSPDGITWTLRSSPFDNNTARGITWNGSLWVAVGNGSAPIAVSPDGVSWLAPPLPPGWVGYALSISWNGTLWLAAGNSSSIVAISPNGNNWTLSNDVGLHGVTSITWNGSFWITTSGTLGTTGNMSTSPDGITWTPLALNSVFGSNVGSAIASRRPLPFVDNLLSADTVYANKLTVNTINGEPCPLTLPTGIVLNLQDREVITFTVVTDGSVTYYYCDITSTILGYTMTNTTNVQVTTINSDPATCLACSILNVAPNAAIDGSLRVYLANDPYGYCVNTAKTFNISWLVTNPTL